MTGDWNKCLKKHCNQSKQVSKLPLFKHDKRTPLHKPQTKMIHAELTHNIYNIRYNITSNAMLVWQLPDFKKASINETVFYVAKTR